MALCSSLHRGNEVCWPHTRLALLLSVVLLVSTVPRGASFDDEEDEDDAHFLPDQLEAITDQHEFDFRVLNMVNDTEHNVKPEYYPVVLFHVSWCKHCQAATKELNKAAAQVAKDLEMPDKKKLAPIPAKFFTLQCDISDDKAMKAICVKYVGSNFPSLIMFRQMRELRYINRPRRADIYKWWTLRCLRPFLHSVEKENHLKKLGEPVFILKTDDRKSKFVEIWQDLAALHMEECSFGVTSSTSEIGVKMLTEEPAVRMWAPDGAGLTPIPYTGTFEIPELRKWVSINQLPQLVKNEAVYFDKLRKAGVPVVVLVHGGRRSGRRLTAAFATYVKNLRPRGNFAFMALDATHEDDDERIKYQFPVLVSKVTEYPRIVVFKDDTYWEDPAFNSIEQATPEGLQALMDNEEARQGPSTLDWFKEKRKIYFRFASKSLQNSLLAVVMPVLLLAFMWKIIKPLAEYLCAKDEDDDEEEEAKPKNGGSEKKEDSEKKDD